MHMHIHNSIPMVDTGNLFQKSYLHFLTALRIPLSMKP